MAEDLSSVVQAWVPRHHMCVLRHRMWAPCHRTPCRPTRPQGWDAPKKLRERWWCHPLTCPLARGERASLEASPPRLRCLYRIWGPRRKMREIAGARPTRPDRATRRRRVRDGRATRQHRVALHFLTKIPSCRKLVFPKLASILSCCLFHGSLCMAAKWGGTLLDRAPLPPSPGGWKVG